MVRFWFKACKKCGGDLALDDGDWICLQCGTYYYVHLYPEGRPRPLLGPGKPVDLEKCGVEGPTPLRSHPATITARLASVFPASGAVNK